MTVSNMTEIDGVPKVHYIRPDESEFIEAIHSNLLRKYRLLYKKDYQGELIIKKIEPNRISGKLIHIKEGRTDESQIKCFLLKLNIKSSIEMQQLIYDAGIGIQNSMGLGIVEVLRK